MKLKRNLFNFLFICFSFIILFIGFSNKITHNIIYIASILYILILLFVVFKNIWGEIFLFFFILTKFIFIEILLHSKLNFFIFAVYLGITFFILSFILLFKDRTRKILIFLFLFIIGIVSIIDIVYFSYFKDFPSVIQFSQIPLVPKVSESIFKLLNTRMILLILDPFLIAYFLKTKIKAKKGIFIFSIFLSLILIFLLFFIIYKSSKEIFVKRFQNKFLVKKVGGFGFHIYDFYYNFKRYFFKASPPEYVLKNMEDLILKSKSLVEENTAYKGKFKGYNLIIIQEESLAGWILDKTIYKEEITPFLNNLKNNSIYFENFFDQTSKGRTSDSEFSALNSLINFSSGSINYLYNTNDFYTLVHRAKKSGYKTIFFHPFDRNFWARNIIIPKYGFDEIYFQEFFELDETIGWGLSNKSLYRQVIEKLKKEKMPFFAYIVTLTGHHPFNEMSEVEGIVSSENLPEIIRNYLKLCRYKDNTLKELFILLEENGFLENSILIYFSDHDPGIFYEDIAKVLLKPCKIVEEYYFLENLPFLIYTKGIDPAKFYVNTGHIDIAPTIVHLFGFDAENWNFFGNNLFSSKNERGIVLPEGAVFDDNYFFDLNKSNCYERYTGRLLDIESCSNLTQLTHF